MRKKRKIDIFDGKFSISSQKSVRTKKQTFDRNWKPNCFHYSWTSKRNHSRVDLFYLWSRSGNARNSTLGCPYQSCTFLGCPNKCGCPTVSTPTYDLIWTFGIFDVETLTWAMSWIGVETLNSVFNVNKAFEKLSKQKIPFTPEETEQILGQTASVLNKLNEKKLELNKEDLQVPEDKLKDIHIKFDLGKYHRKILKS